MPKLIKSQSMTQLAFCGSSDLFDLSPLLDLLCEGVNQLLYVEESQNTPSKNIPKSISLSVLDKLLRQEPISPQKLKKERVQLISNDVLTHISDYLPESSLRGLLWVNKATFQYVVGKRDVAELARFPFVVRSPYFPKNHLNNYQVILNALSVDPSVCLLAGKELQKNKEKFKLIMKNAIAECILGDYSKEKEKQICELAKICKLAKSVLPSKNSKICNIETLEGSDWVKIRSRFTQDSDYFEQIHLKDVFERDLDISYDQTIAYISQFKSDSGMRNGNKGFELCSLFNIRAIALRVLKDGDRFQLGTNAVLAYLSNSDDADVVERSLPFIEDLGFNSLVHAPDSIREQPRFKSVLQKEVNKLIQLKGQAVAKHERFPLGLVDDPQI